MSMCSPNSIPNWIQLLNGRLYWKYSFQIHSGEVFEYFNQLLLVSYLETRMVLNDSNDSNDTEDHNDNNDNNNFTNAPYDNSFDKILSPSKSSMHNKG